MGKSQEMSKQMRTFYDVHIDDTVVQGAYDGTKMLCYSLAQYRDVTPKIA